MIAEEAAEWFIALKYPEARTKAEFLEWLKVSPEHVGEFLAVAALWDALPDVSAQPSIEELARLAAGDDNVIALSDPNPPIPDAPVDTPQDAVHSGTRRGPVRHVWLGFATAATLAVIVTGGLLTLVPPPEDPNLHTTAIGQQTSIPLPDGSMVTLNTQSTVRVDYSDGYRDIELLRGEALFDVAKDASRPFRVITDYAVIRAVGTQFNVRSAAEDVTVTVVEGIVDVSVTAARNPPGKAARGSTADQPASAVIEPVRLTVGQQATVESRSGEVTLVQAKVGKAIAWQQRRLVFESLSLKEVIDEFNRYNDPPLLIDDRELEQLPISGVFRSNDRDSFVQFLSQMGLAEPHTRADGTIVLRSPQSDQ